MPWLLPAGGSRRYTSGGPAKPRSGIPRHAAAAVAAELGSSLRCAYQAPWAAACRASPGAWPSRPPPPRGRDDTCPRHVVRAPRAIPRGLAPGGEVSSQRAGGAPLIAALRLSGAAGGCVPCLPRGVAIASTPSPAPRRDLPAARRGGATTRRAGGRGPHPPPHVSGRPPSAVCACMREAMRSLYMAVPTMISIQGCAAPRTSAILVLMRCAMASRHSGTAGGCPGLRV